MTLKRVLIMAGGTGGHVFPGLSVAAQLKKQQVDVHWLGTPHGLEAELVREHHYPLHFVSVQGLRRNGIKLLLTAPFKLTQALYQSLRIIQHIKPDVILGMGGFVSGPGGLAAWLLRKPLIIHEQNAKAGLTNQLLARLAKKVLAGFPDAFKAKTNVLTIGNPVRAEIENLPPPDVRMTDRPFQLLVLGGSRGAQALNEIVPQVLANLPQAARPHILHQTGEQTYEKTLKDYQRHQLSTDNVMPFIRDIAHAYARADMVLCRAGALTVAELCAAGVGAIFVPFPYAVDDHQTANAKIMVKNKAAICIQQAELTVATLTAAISNFSQSAKECLSMAMAARDLRHVAVAEKIVDICQEVCP